MPFKKITDIKKLKLRANEIRLDIIRMLVSAGSGHSAGPLDMADVFTAVYFNVMNHDPKNPKWEGRDKFVLSNGHICPVLYATLAHAGYFPRKELLTLRKLGTRLHGHPHNLALPGLENSAGPLAQGFSVACGIALAAKMDKKKTRVYCSLGDGEMQEGQVWEALMFAAKYKLDNLTAFVDRNYIQIDGPTEDIMPLDPFAAKIKAFNWHVIEIDGNKMESIVKAFKDAQKVKGKPTMLICNTIPGKGVTYMEGRFEWHGKPPTKDQGEIAIMELCKQEYKLQGIHCKSCATTLSDCKCLEGE